MAWNVNTNLIICLHRKSGGDDKALFKPDDLFAMHYETFKIFLSANLKKFPIARISLDTVNVGLFQLANKALCVHFL